MVVYGNIKCLKMKLKIISHTIDLVHHKWLLRRCDKLIYTSVKRLRVLAFLEQSAEKKMIM
jgi:hypothetical protein